MVKRNWDKAGLYEADPGAVIEVKDSGGWSGNDDHPFVPKGHQARKQAKKRKRQQGQPRWKPAEKLDIWKSAREAFERVRNPRDR